MSKRLMMTILKPAHAGFGEWDWTEAMDLAVGPVIEETEEDCYYAYESVLGDAQVDFRQTDELSGKIHNECGRVYSINGGESYEMVWAEDEESTS